jgi:hypothetical protein
MREWFRCAGPVVCGLVVFALLVNVALAASPLDGTQWTIQMTAPSAPAPPDGQIHFKNGKFVSAPFEPQGFAPSNYTLTEQDGAPMVWETMQTSATEGTLSWRGELGGDTMRGVASWQKADGKAVTYTFIGKRVGEAPRAAKPKPEAPSVVKPKAEAPSATEAKPEETKAAKPKAKPKPKAKAPVQSKPE